MNIVIDTNVIASAIFFEGKPLELIERLMHHEFDSFVTMEIIDEYSETIEYLIHKYPEKKVTVPLTHIVTACHLIDENSDVSVCRDPDDNKFINCAIDSQAIYIVSGDKDLLDLEKYEDIEIITVAEFLKKIAF